MFHHTSSRQGVTLIELMLALVLLAIGATALAGGMHGAVKSTAVGRAWMAGAFAVEARFERLRARCTPSSGTRALGAVHESWVVGGAAGAMLPAVQAEDSITLSVSTGSRGRTVRSIVRCVP